MSSTSSFSGRVRPGDRVLFDPGADLGKAWATVERVLDRDRLFLRFDHDGTMIVPASLCWGRKGST